MSRSAFLIFNPVAGQGDPDEDLAIIKQHLEPEFELEIAHTTPEKGAAQLARQAKAKNVECAIVAGGDGTISAVVTV
jgi:diacylglycerol kinase family enzyme